MDDQKETVQVNSKLSKSLVIVSVFGFIAFIYVIFNTFYGLKAEQSSGALPVPVKAINADPFIASDAFDLLEAKEDVALTPLSIGELEAKLTAQFQRHVFLKNIKGAPLYLAVIGDDMFFVDSTGTYMLDGRLLDIDNNLILSDLIQEEINSASRHLLALRSARLDGVNSFLDGKNHKRIVKSYEDKGSSIQKASVSKTHALPVATNSKEINHKSNKAAMNSIAVDTDIRASSMSKNSKFTELPMGLNQQLNIAPDLLNMASSLSLSDTAFEDKCLTVSLGANSYAEMYHLYQSMKSKSVMKKCGEVYASKLIPQLDDKDLIVYEAPNAKRSITIISDFTCPYCRKLHDETQKYLDAGVTVRVFPYGRASYMNNGELTAVGKNNSLAQCQLPSKKGELFDTLLSNPTLYKSKVLSGNGVSLPSEKCQQVSFIYKVIGDILTSRETPIIINDEGNVARGYFPASSLLSKWGML